MDKVNHKEIVEEKLFQPAPTQTRRVRYTSFYYLNKSQRIWSILIISMVLDPILMAIWSTLRIRPFSDQFLTLTSVLAIIVCVIAVARDRVMRNIEKLRRWREDLINQRKLWPLIVLAIAIVSAIVDAGLRAMQLGSFGAMAIIVVIIVLFGTAISIARTYNETYSRWATLRSDRILWIENTNLQNFIAVIVPLCLARCISLAAALQYGNSANLRFNTFQLPIDYLLSAGVTFLLLIALRPVENQFIVNCPTCMNRTSRAVLAIGCCPRCKPENFGIEK